MPSADGHDRRRGCGRWVLRCVVLGVLLGALIGGALLTGLPQRLAAGLAVSSQLNGRATFTSVGLGNPLAVQGFTLSEKAASIYGPVLEIDRAEAAYHLRPEGGRYIESVSLDGVRVSVQQGEAANNFQFLRDLFAQPGGGGDVTPWIPERVTLGDLWLEINFPGYYLRAENLSFDAGLDSMRAGSATFGSPEAALAWSSTIAPGGPQTGAGAIAIDAAWTGEGADIDAEVDLGLLARLRGSLSVVLREGTPHYAVSIPEAALHDPLWSAMLADRLPVPARFEALALKDSEVHFHLPDGGVAVDQARVDASVTALSVGPAEAPYYNGPLQVVVRGNYGAETEISGTATLREQLALEGTFKFTPAGLEGSAGFEPWPREDLIALIPAAYAGIIDLFQPLKALGAKVDVNHSAGTLALDGTVTAAFEREALQIPITVSWGADGAAPSITASATSGESQIQSVISLREGAPVSLANTLSKVSPNAWTSLLFGREMIPGLAASLSGTAHLSLPEGQPVSIDAALSSAGLGYGSIALPQEPPVTIAGKLTYDTGTGIAAGAALTLAQEGTASLVMSKWSLNTAKAAVEAALASTVSLDAVGALFGLSDLSGEASIAGQLSAGPARTTLSEFTAESESLAYGEDWSVPYGSLLALSGSLTYDTAAGGLTFEPVRATMGEGTRCALASLALQFSTGEAPFTMASTGLSLESDLAFLEKRGVLDSATGARAVVTSENLAWTGASFSGLTQWDLKAEAITLPEKMLSMVNLVYAGGYDPGVNEARSGRLSADSFSVYEIPFGAVNTEVKLTPENVACDSLETTFLGGKLAMSGTLNYRDPAFPGTVAVRADGLDLEQFTQTFKPPDVVMTGRVSGTADLAISMEGLVDLNVDMTASENLTLNQSAVRQILMQQYVNDAVGSKKIQEIIEKVIGKDEQRAFEKAVLTLRLEDGLIVGTARLESKNLDVTVDIKAEPEAILQAIQSASENN